MIFGNGKFGDLKRDIAAMAHDFRAGLDQLFLQTRRQHVRKITGIVGQRMKLKADGVGGEL